MTKSIRNVIKVSILALVLSFGLSYAYAWTAPTATPPTGNVSAPINTSATAQTKAGGLTVSGLLTAGMDIIANGVTVGRGAGNISSNTALGINALFSNTSGSTNTASGIDTLRSNTTGSYNTANGFNSLYSNTTGSTNTASGHGSLSNNTTGNYNTANGYGSLFNSKKTSYNTANGNQALGDIGTNQFAGALVAGVTYTITNVGTTNFVLIGASSNTVGVSFIATGAGTGTGTATIFSANNNSAFGSDSGRGIISGSGNSIFGANVTGLPANLTNNIILANGTGAIKAQHDGTNWTMTGNVGLGVTAPAQKLDVAGNINVSTGSAYMYNGSNVIRALPGLSNYFFGGAGNLTTTGDSNTATGYAALQSNTSGNRNTATGYGALSSNTGGIGLGLANTATGFGALLLNTTGNNNTANGNQALNTSTGNNNTATGNMSLVNNNTGSGNTATGMNALITNTTGAFNTAIGYNADVSPGTLTNATAIGFGAVVTASNKVRVGNASVTSIVGAVGFLAESDARLKENIFDYKHGLDFITKLRPVSYNLKADKTHKTHNGFIAQEVEATGVPFYGIDKPESKDDYYALSYGEFVVPLVNAVKELKVENDKLKADNDDLRLRIEKIEARLK